MDLMQFIPEQLLLLIGGLYVLGILLKRIKIVKDNLIPLILVTFSILCSLGLVGLSATAVLQGILCWGVSIGINQTGKQIRKGIDSDE